MAAYLAMDCGEALFLELKNKVSNKEDIKDILAEMKRYAEVSVENQIDLGSTGCIELLANLITKSDYSSNPSDFESMVWVLCRLFRRSMEKSTSCTFNCDKFVECNGCWNLLEGFSFHVADNEGITYVSALAIMILASDSIARQVALAQAGACLALAAVMFKYGDNPRVAEMACKAVRNMSSSHDEIGAAMVSEGICEGIVGAMKHCKDSLSTVEAALWAVINLSCDSQVATIFGSAGIFPVILEIMANNTQESSLVFAACGAIRNLCSESNFNLSIVSHLKEPYSLPDVFHELLRHYRCSYQHMDAVEVTETSLSHSSGIQHDDDVVEAILWALANVSGMDDLAKQLMDHRMLCYITHLLEEINRSPHRLLQDDNEIVEAALWIYRNLILSVDHKHKSSCQSNSLTPDSMNPIIRRVFADFVEERMVARELPDLEDDDDSLVWNGHVFTKLADDNINTILEDEGKRRNDGNGDGDGEADITDTDDECRDDEYGRNNNNNNNNNNKTNSDNCNSSTNNEPMDNNSSNDLNSNQLLSTISDSETNGEEKESEIDNDNSNETPKEDDSFQKFMAKLQIRTGSFHGFLSVLVDSLLFTIEDLARFSTWENDMLPLLAVVTDNLVADILESNIDASIRLKKQIFSDGSHSSANEEPTFVPLRSYSHKVEQFIKLWESLHIDHPSDKFLARIEYLKKFVARHASSSDASSKTN